jgi:hypothetical protein
MMRTIQSLLPALLPALLLALGGLGACAAPHPAQYHPPQLWIGARFVQAPVFDGHELWVDYDCSGVRLTVRYLGDWADAFTADRGLHHLDRRPARRPVIDYAGAGYRLAGYAPTPSWTAPGAAPVQCRGSL